MAPDGYGFLVISRVANSFTAVRGWVRVRKPVSLRRLVQRSYREMDRRGSFAGRVQELAAYWEAIPSFARALILPIVIIAATVAILFVPCPEHLAALSDAKSATAFLSVAWPVTGGSFAFSIVVLVFAYQTIAAVRQSVGVRDLAVGTPLLIVVYLGIAAVLADGLALLGIGYQAPAGWAASWSTITSGSAMALLALLIAASLRAVDPQVQQARRIRMLRRRTMAAIRAEAIKRLALTSLIADGKKAGYTVSPLESAGPPRPSTESVSSRRPGAIGDIRLDRLRRVARTCASAGLPSPVVTAFIMRDLGVGARLVVFPEALGARSRRRLAAAFKTTRHSQSAPPSLLVAAVDELHQEAMQVIDAGRAMAFEAACQAQQQTLLAFPEAWANLGQAFTSDLASGVLPLQTGPLDRLSQHLLDQAMKAVGHGDREIAASAVGLPLRVAVEAVPLSAHALTDQMLGVLARITATASGSPAGVLDRQMQGNALRNITSYMGYVVIPRIEKTDLPEVDRQDAVTFLAESAGVLADVLKNAVEVGDPTFFDEGVAQWRQLGRQWLGNADVYSGSVAPEDYPQRGREVLDRQRFVLGAWLLGRLWNDAANSAALHTFSAATWFENVQYLFDLAEMPFDDPASGRLTSWVLWARTDSHSGPIDISIDTTTPILRMLVVTAFRSGIQPGFRLRPSQWLHDNAQSLDAVISQVEAAHDLAAAVGITDVAGQAAALRAAIGEAAAEQERILEGQLVQAQVDQARVQAFAIAVRDAWGQRRIGVTLLRQTGAYEEADGSRPEARFGFGQYEPKDRYVGDRVGGLERYAQQIGSRMADAENGKLVEVLARARPLRHRAGDVNRKLELAREEMQRRGYQPTAVFVTWRSWEVPQEFDLQRASDQAGQLGTFEGLPVIQARPLGGNTIVLADLKALAAFRQWIQNGQALAVTVTGYDEPSAMAAVRADRKLMLTTGRPRLADRARELRKSVLVEVWEECELTVRDADAARAVWLPSARVGAGMAN
jgi:hypothetical protein